MRAAAESRRAAQAERENAELRASQIDLLSKIERLESELAAAEEEKHTVARRHQWEVAELQRRLVESCQVSLPPSLAPSLSSLPLSLPFSPSRLSLSTETELCEARKARQRPH